MDTTDAPASGPIEATLAPRGSQSKLSAAIFFVLLAALLLRVVTAVTDRNAHPEAAAHDHGPPPLVAWLPLEKAAPASKASGKPALYDFTAEWCPPCHRLDEEGWSDEALAGMANRGYVPARVMDRSREEGKNSPLVEELQRRYAVEAFPTLIVAGADGKEIARLEGWAGRDALRKFLEESKGKAGGGPAAAIAP
jgi:thiol:disulfide interchange protein